MNCYLRLNETALRRLLDPGQYGSIRDTERVADAGLEPSVGSVGDSYDKALAETADGLYEAAVTHRAHPGAAAKRANGQRCSDRLAQQPVADGTARHTTPAEAEAHCSSQIPELPIAA